MPRRHRRNRRPLRRERAPGVIAPVAFYAVVVMMRVTVVTMLGGRKGGEPRRVPVSVRSLCGPSASWRLLLLCPDVPDPCDGPESVKSPWARLGNKTSQLSHDCENHTTIIA